MNDALASALEKKGIRTEVERQRFAASIPISERTLRRWIKNEIERPHKSLQKAAARKLGMTPEDLWPTP